MEVMQTASNHGTPLGFAKHPKKQSNGEKQINKITIIGLLVLDLMRRDPAIGE
jgi:hypothetical protein